MRLAGGVVQTNPAPGEENSMAPGRPRSFLVDSARAHAMLFESPLKPSYDEAVGGRVLAAFTAAGLGLFFVFRRALEVSGWRGSLAGRAMFVLALLAAFVVLQRFWVRAPFAAVGLRRVADWTRLERLYLAQVVPMAAIGFSLVFRQHLRGLLEAHGAAGLAPSVLTGLVWGAVQEFLYRGWLQTELTRRFGWVAGLSFANLVFTFGPLHADKYLGGAIRWGELAAIFWIGLLFGLLYRRSGNLWIPALLHGLWPLNMN
jgi:uncharacterized protein